MSVIRRFDMKSGMPAGEIRVEKSTGFNDIEVASPAEFDAALETAKARHVVAVLVSRGAAAVYVPIVRRGN